NNETGTPTADCAPSIIGGFEQTLTFTPAAEPPRIFGEFVTPPNFFVSELEVAGMSGEIANLEVTVNADHTWDSDVHMWLEGPNGLVKLFGGVGADGYNFQATVFRDDARTAIEEGRAPFSAGPYRPQQPLSTFDGSLPNGR